MSARPSEFPCPVCGLPLADHPGDGKTPSMAHGPCQFTDGSARCVFGPDHAVDYHHLDDGRNVPGDGAA